MFAIGPFTPASRVFLAPMSGISDLPMRVQAARAGAGLVVSEMVASHELILQKPETVTRAAGGGVLSPLVIQLAGREARWMEEGAGMARDGGADIIDINMGCPARKVTGGLSGSALMRNLDHALTLIEATQRGAAGVPVTLKMRLGWDHDCINAPELARRAEAAGVAMVTVHGRTRNQFYDGVADWAAVAAVRDAIRIPLVVNGDVADAASARRALTLSGADAVMVGRAALGRPWLPGAIAGALEQGGEAVAPPLNERHAAFVEQYRAMIDLYGAPLGVRAARKHLAAFVDSLALDLGAEARRAARVRLCQTASPDATLKGLESLVSQADEGVAQAA